MKKKVIALLLMTILLLSVGASAFAEGETGVQRGDIVIMGRWNDQPIRWSVLDPAATNVGEPGVFLVTEQMLTNQGVMYNGTAKAVWKGSDGQAWCTRFYQDNLSALEQAAVPAVSKNEDAMQAYGLSWKDIALEEENVFFLSTKETLDYFDPEVGDPALTTTFIGDNKVYYYWLRTPHAIHGDYAGYVIDANNVHDYVVYGSWGTRPAMNLGGDGFLYLTPADGQLSVRALGDLPTSATGEWKATAVDSAIALRVEGTVYRSGQLTVDYSGAPANGWISVMVRDEEGRNLSYGCLGQSAGGSGSVSLVPELPEGASLYLFAEVDNGPGNTNSASALCPLSWTEEPPPTPEPTPTPAPTEAPEQDGSISLVNVSPLPVDPNDSGLKNFLRQYWMFAIPTALLFLIAVAALIITIVVRRRREEYGYYDDYYYDDDYENEEEYGDEDKNGRDDN